MKTSKWQAVLIVAIAVCTPLLATALFFLAPPQETTNRGELITPVSLPPGTIPARTDGEAAWYLLTLGEPECDIACQQRLCLLRQVRLVHMGDIQRVGRLWLVDGSGNLPEDMAMEPGCGRDLPAAQAGGLAEVDILDGVAIKRVSKQFIDTLPAPAQGHLATHYLYLVDAQSQVVMRYPNTTPARDIAKDLGRLLRLSRRG